MKPRRYMLLVAGVLALALTIGFQAASAQRGGESPPPPAALDYLCVSGYTGVIRDVSSPACQPHETLLTLPDDYPFLACASTYTGVLRHAGDGDASCRGYESAVLIPSEASDAQFCVMSSTGILKLVATANQCPTGGTVASFGQPPETVDDSYATLGNVPINVPVAGGLLANDTANDGTVSDIDTTGTNGTVTVEPNGSFRYAPPAGFTGIDTFAYTVTNSSGDATATVTIEVDGPMIWFVDSEYPGTGTGTLDDPFSFGSQISNNGVDPDDPGDIIFLLERATPYNGTLALETGQTLIGQEVDLATITGISVPPFSALPQVDPSANVPTITSDTGDGVLLAPGVTVAGLAVTDTAEAGIFGGTFFGDVTLDQITVSEPGIIPPSDTNPGTQFPAVELYQIVGTVTVTGSQITGADSNLVAGIGLSASHVTELNIIAGTSIAGGDAASDQNSQTGGAGIYGLNVEITLDAATVRGGDAIDTSDGPRDAVFTGGHGVALEGASVTVNDGSTVAGGAAVSNSEGRPLGSAGSGIEANLESSVTVSASTVTGGQAGGRIGSGSGIRAQNATVTVQDGAIVTGGTGDDGGRGGSGNGIDVGRSVLVVDNASVNGGATPSGTIRSVAILSKESDTTVRNGATITGGTGITAQRDGTLTVTDASVSAAPDTGRAAISTDDVDVNISGSTITGGRVGDPEVIPTVAVQSSREPVSATLTDNTLLTDDPTVPSLMVITNQEDSSLCLNASGNSNGAGGRPVGLFRLDHRAGVLGITQATLVGLSEANNDVGIVGTGAISFSCSQG